MSHMDYFNDVLSTFLSLEPGTVGGSDVYGVRMFSDFIKNNLICVLRVNEGLRGLERHEGDDRIFIFGWTIHLNKAPVYILPVY